MKAHVYSINGKQLREIQLPGVFEEKYLPGVIATAVTSLQSRRLQPKGASKRAGLDTTAEYIGRRRAYRSGINRAMARLPRVKLGGGGLGAVKRVPHAVGGRKAHPPKPEKVLVKRLNVKERRLALRSAIAATAARELVEKRGHKIEGVKEIPLIVEDTFEKTGMTKDAIAVLKKLGLDKDLERACQAKVRAGKATKRGNKYKRKKGVLIVLGKGGAAVKACRNIPGVDVCLANALNVELLAPGTHAGRIALWTESALKQVGESHGR